MKPSARSSSSTSCARERSFRVTRWRSRPRASNWDAMVPSAVVVEPVLQDHGRSRAVDVFLAYRAAPSRLARRLERVVRRRGAQLLVERIDGEQESAVQAAREALRLRGNLRARRGVIIRDPDDESGRLPFRQQRGDAGPVGPGVGGGERQQGAGAARQGIAHGDADAAPTVVEPQQGAPAGRHAQAWPASGDNAAMFTPSSAAADSQRLSKGTEKMMSAEAGTVSQELAAISASSWPAPQPA